MKTNLNYAKEDDYFVELKVTNDSTKDLLKTIFKRPSLFVENCIGDDGKEVKAKGISYEDYLYLVKTRPGVVQELPKYVKYAIDFKRELKIDVNTLNKNIVDRIGLETWNILYPFQQECIRFNLIHDSRILVADDMGLGKTKEALITFLYYLKHPTNKKYNGLILTTAKCRTSWKKEIESLPHECNPLIISSGTKLKEFIKGGGFKHANNLLITSFTLITNYLQEIYNLDFDFLIVDESQSINNYKSKRSGAIVQLTKHIKRALYLSGTPMEKPKMLFPMMHAMLPHLFEDYFKFRDRYCDPQESNIVKKVKNQDGKVVEKRIKIVKDDGRVLSNELHFVLSNLLMIRRLKKDVNIKLPPKVRLRYMLKPSKKQIKEMEKTMEKVDLKDVKGEEDFGKGNDFMNAYRKIATIKLPLIDRFVRKLFKGAAPPLTPAEFLCPPIYSGVDLCTVSKKRKLDQKSDQSQKLNQDQKIDNYETYEDEDEFDDEKVEIKSSPFGQGLFPVTLAKSHLAGSKGAQPPCEKILFFGHHKQVLSCVEEILEEHQIGFVKIDGELTKEKDIQLAIDLFQTDPSCQVALLSITSTNAGITLTAGTIVVFLELYPTSKEILQAECRAHRIGQEHPVKCIYLIFPGSIEEVLWQIINKKFKSMTSIIDGKMEYFVSQKIQE